MKNSDDLRQQDPHKAKTMTARWRNIPFDELARCHNKQHQHPGAERDRAFWEANLRGHPVEIELPALATKCPQGHEMYQTRGITIGNGGRPMVCIGYIDIDADEPYGLKKLNLEPGDVLVMSFKQIITYEMRERIKANCELVFPDRKVLIIDNETELSILHENKEQSYEIPNNPGVDGHQKGPDAV